MTDLDDLIAEARQWAPCAMSPGWQLKLITKLADALATVRAERDAALARIAEQREAMKRMKVQRRSNGRRAQQAEARIAEAAKLHRLEPVISTGFPPLEPGSAYCSQGCEWPCATRTALGLPLTLGLNEGESTDD